ncbi:MAG: hypothetical protein ABS69_12330 [Nitrosomonadales bacterium SCN 54-20]|nr:MAG: hypothetical protein ABS69_12330 [Nitrosomonadales bacterium SCN 54-20]
MVASRDLSLKDTFLRMMRDLAAFLKTGVLLQYVLMMLFCADAEFVDRASFRPGPILSCFF